jgi:hypothetical protein
MVMRRVPLFVLVLLGAAATFSDVAIADEEEADPRCQVQMCYEASPPIGQCRSTWEDGGNCNDRCNQLGCDGGSQVGGTFSCIPGSSSTPFMICQCNSCPGSGGGTGGGGTGGGGGGGETCHEYECWEACFEEYACMDFESYCSLGQCWCEVYLEE